MKRYMRPGPLLYFCIVFPLCAEPAGSISYVVEPPGESTTLCTRLIQERIDAASTAGGGIVHLTKGTYLTGTLQLKEGVTLDLAEGTVLRGSPLADDYPPVGSFVDGVGQKRDRVLIIAHQVNHVGISGKGMIDGQGLLLKQTKVHPFLVRFEQCRGVKIDSVTLARAGSWTCHLWDSDDISITNVTILPSPVGNNDGIDIDASRDVNIRNCHITSGDDAVCLKATIDKPCQRIQITECTMHTHWNGFKIGTESMGDFEDITIRDCIFDYNASGGIRLYSVDGANIRRVRVENITLTDTNLPVYIRLGARLKAFRTGQPAKPVGSIEDVTIRNVHGKTHGRALILVSGIPGHPVRGLHVEDVDCFTPGGEPGKGPESPVPEKENAYPEPYSIFGPLPSYGLYLRHVEDSFFSRITVRCEKEDSRHAVVCDDVRNTRIDSMVFRNPSREPASELRIDGSGSKTIELQGWIPHGVERGAGVLDGALLQH